MYNLAKLGPTRCKFGNTEPLQFRVKLAYQQEFKHLELVESKKQYEEEHKGLDAITKLGI